MADRDLLKRHAALLDQMAETIGVDLQDAAIRGELRMGELGDAVLDCAQCARSGECISWMESSAKTASQPPEYCLNRAVLVRLAAGRAQREKLDFKGVAECGLSEN